MEKEVKPTQLSPLFLLSVRTSDTQAIGSASAEEGWCRYGGVDHSGGVILSIWHARLIGDLLIRKKCPRRRGGRSHVGSIHLAQLHTKSLERLGGWGLLC